MLWSYFTYQRLYAVAVSICLSSGDVSGKMYLECVKIFN